MVLRRDKHKAAAKAGLEQALGVFERLGALLWVEATKAELGRVGLRPAASTGVSGMTADSPTGATVRAVSPRGSPPIPNWP